MIIDKSIIKEIKENLQKSYIKVDYKSKLFMVTDTLVTTQMYCDFLNNLTIKNNADDTYLFFNHVQSNNDIYLDKDIYYVKTGKENSPVRGVNWYGALLFCHLIKGRLISNNEWEYVASSGRDDYIYPWGNEEPKKNYANFGNNIGDTTPVKSFPKNAMGFYDMAGNVREWTQDIYNPKHGETIETYYRIVKGGAWDKTSEHLKIKKNSGKWMRVGTQGIGFRVLWDI